jgi:hypothetical protein
MKQPTNLKRLEEIITDGNWPDPHDHVFMWLQWTYEHLTERNLYHKKQQIKKRMMVKLATSLLSKDELDEVDKQAEEALDADTSGNSRSDVRGKTDDLDIQRGMVSEEDSEVESD